MTRRVVSRLMFDKWYKNYVNGKRIFFQGETKTKNQNGNT